MHHRLGSVTLLQLAFPGESNPNFPRKKSHWDNTVVKKKKERKKKMRREWQNSQSDHSGYSQREEAADLLSSHRLASSWKALYKSVLSYQQGALSEMNYQHARQLLFLIQQSLQAINATVPHSVALPINKGECSLKVNNFLLLFVFSLFLVHML